MRWMCAVGSVLAVMLVLSASPVSAAVAPVYAINCAGPQYTAADGMVYEADSLNSYYTGGNTASTSAPIAGTNDDVLYQSERYAKTFAYNLPIANGQYVVRLQMAETYQTSTNKRVFDVLIEGDIVLDDLDIYQEVGHDVAVDYERTVTVGDGEMNIAFTTSVDNAKISALCVTPVPEPATLALLAVGGLLVARRRG